MAVIPEDIATTLLRPMPDQIVISAWEMWIEDARRQIKSRLGDLDLLDQGDLDYVVREAVALKAKRPDGVRKVDVAVDDGSVSKTYEVGTGQVTILDGWWALLTPDEDERGAFTINPFSGRRC